MDPCEVCTQSIKDGFKTQADCENCTTTRLLSANNMAWEITGRIEKGIITRFHSHGGNVCHEAIQILRKRGWQSDHDLRLVTMGTPFFHDRSLLCY